MIDWNFWTGTVSVFLKLALLFVFVHCFKVFPKSWKSHCWLVLGAAGVHPNVSAFIFSKMNQQKSWCTVYFFFPLILSHTSLSFVKNLPLVPLFGSPQHEPWDPVGLMNVVEPVDHIEEGEDRREDHPGPLINRVHVRKVWDVHLELRGPSP